MDLGCNTRKFVQVHLLKAIIQANRQASNVSKRQYNQDRPKNIVVFNFCDIPGLLGIC